MKKKKEIQLSKDLKNPKSLWFCFCQSRFWAAHERPPVESGQGQGVPVLSPEELP